MQTNTTAIATLARRAGREAHSEAHCWYRPRLDDAAPRVADAWDAWSARAVLSADGDWDAAERAFADGWQDAIDAL